MKSLFSRLSVLASILLLLLSGCGGNSAPAASEEVFYLVRLMLYDSGMNMVGMYPAEQIGSQETTVRFDDTGKIEYSFYYHGELEKTWKGSMSDPEEGESSTSYKVLFEGDGNENFLMRSTDEDGEETIVLIYKYDADHFAGATFKKDKVEKTVDEMKDITIKEKDLFEESDIYKKICQTLDDSKLELDYRYDKEDKVLLIQYQAPAGLYDAIKAAPDKIRDSFDGMCSSFAEIASKYHAAISTAGYREVTCRVEMLSDKDGTSVIYRSDDGNEVYKEAYGSSSGSGSSSSGSSSSGGSSSSSSSGSSSGSSSSSGFTSSKVYNDIYSICMDSFKANDPKLKYDASKNTLTLTLTAPRGTHDAIDDEDMNSMIAWFDWTGNLAGVSEAGYGMLCDEGYSNIAFIIMICSDKDPSICLYATMNGQDYYNFAEE